MKREPFLFQTLEYLLRGPIQYWVPIQTRGATRNAPKSWLHFRDGRFRPVRAFLPPDPARRQDHLIRKTINQSPTDHRGLEFEVQNRIEAVDQGMISFTQLSPA